MDQSHDSHSFLQWGAVRGGCSLVVFGRPDNREKRTNGLTSAHDPYAPVGLDLRSQTVRSAAPFVYNLFTRPCGIGRLRPGGHRTRCRDPKNPSGQPSCRPRSRHEESPEQSEGGSLAPRERAHSARSDERWKPHPGRLARRCAERRRSRASASDVLRDQDLLACRRGDTLVRCEDPSEVQRIGCRHGDRSCIGG